MSSRHQRRKLASRAHKALGALRVERREMVQPGSLLPDGTISCASGLASSLATKGARLGLDLVAVGHGKGFTRGDMPSLKPGRIRSAKSHNRLPVDANAPSARLNRKAP